MKNSLQSPEFYWFKNNNLFFEVAHTYFTFFVVMVVDRINFRPVLVGFRIVLHTLSKIFRVSLKYKFSKEIEIHYCLMQTLQCNVTEFQWDTNNVVYNCGPLKFPYKCKGAK